MAKIEFLGPLSSKDTINIDVKSMNELKEFLKQDKELSKWLDICSIAINDELVFDVNRKIDIDDKIAILPPVCGG